MSKVIAFLECGCAMLEGGGRTWCPTCEAVTVRSLFGAAPDLPAEAPEKTNPLADRVKYLEGQLAIADEGTVTKDKTIESLKAWIADLQSGMYINCVYCGHRYGPNDEVPASMADVLKRHIEVCPKHPMSALAEELRQLREAAVFAGNTIRNGKPYESLDDDEKHALDWLNTLLPAEMEEKK